jgi:mono/diheme cytochrome c family protein
MTSLRSNLVRVLLLAAVALGIVGTSGCDRLRQDMGSQPKYLPLEPSDFFHDGRSERPLLENTVARGSVDNDKLLLPKDSNEFPLKVDLDLLERGKERYGAYCTPCHGLQGDGNGMVVMRGMKRPPSYHSDRLRESPNGYFYEVITNGFGQMYGYASQIPPRDRWAIVAYVRALQLSRNAHAAELPAELRQKLSSGDDAK